MPGRNDPCPCGSGKKYKKCCLAIDTAPRPPTDMQRAHAWHALDRELVKELARFGRRTLGPDFGDEIDELADLAEYDPSVLQIAPPYLAYHCLEPWTAARAWLARGSKVEESTRRWIEACSRAWISVWEVQRTVPGQGIELLDLLTGAQRTVTEAGASAHVVARDCLLAHVVDIDGLSLLACHSRALTPLDAAEVIRSLRRQLRTRARCLPLARLRSQEAAATLIASWSEVVQGIDARPPPTLTNTDGDPLLLTSDRFGIDPSRQTEILERLVALEGAGWEEDDSVTFTRPGNAMHASWDNTIVGHARVDGSRLVLETNSVARADALRDRVVALLGDLLQPGPRSHTNFKLDAPSGPRAPPQEPSPEEAAALREVSTAAMLDAIDRSIPALGGHTPREAASNPRLREKLEVLLREWALLAEAPRSRRAR